VVIGALALITMFGVVACSGDDGSDPGSTEPVLITGAPVDQTTVPPTTVAGPADASTPVSTSLPGDEPAGTTPADASSAPDESTAPDDSGSDRTAAPDDPPSTPPAGDINQTIPDEPQQTLAPIALDEPATVGQVELAVDDVERIEGQARLPGEIAGPALAVQVRLVNNGSSTLDLSDVSVNLTDAEGAIAPPLTADPAEPFTGTLAAGQSATATYVFEFADGRPQPVRIDVSSSAGTPVAVFTGTVS
jgi:hypothetical protein